MDNKLNEQNQTSNYVTLNGTVLNTPVINHTVYGENFYSFNLQVKRLSDAYDEIPVVLSERLINIEEITEGTRVEIIGQMRSYNSYSEEQQKNKLILMVFVKDIKLENEEVEEVNDIELNGFICKPPMYRRTPFGREICDILVAVNRNYNKSDYIPCICWGRNARYAEGLEVGSNIKLNGRIQSRTYQKKVDEEKYEEKIAYEVSVFKLENIVEN